MPCYSPPDDIISCKLVCMYPENFKRFGLSSHIVYVVLFDAKTGKLLSLMVSLYEITKYYDVSRLRELPWGMAVLL